MGRRTENYSRRLIVILLLCLYLDVWDLFIYLLFIICSTLVFILSALLSISPGTWFRLFTYPLSAESFIIIHHGSSFGFRSFIYFTFSFRVWWGFVDYVSRHITRVKAPLFFSAFGVNW